MFSFFASLPCRSRIVMRNTVFLQSSVIDDSSGASTLVHDNVVVYVLMKDASEVGNNVHVLHSLHHYLRFSSTCSIRRIFVSSVPETAVSDPPSFSNALKIEK